MDGACWGVVLLALLEFLLFTSISNNQPFWKCALLGPFSYPSLLL